METLRRRRTQTSTLTLYEVNVAKKTRSGVILDWVYWDYFTHSFKYLKGFLGVKNMDEINERIKTGQYRLGYLNTKETYCKH